MMRREEGDEEKAKAIYRIRDKARKRFPGNIKTNRHLAAFFWDEIANLADGSSRAVPIDPAKASAKRAGRKRGAPSVEDKTFVASVTPKKSRKGKEVARC